MIDFLYGLDKAVLLFINQTLSNPVSDTIWPLITSYDQYILIRLLLAALWIGLIVRGGRRGRTVAFLLIPILICSDMLSSAVLKEIFNRDRPCHGTDGHRVVEGIRLLVACGPGRSFPSSHAVNNFAVALLFSIYYNRSRWYVFSWAALVALSRPAVGVHYPSDILGGAVVGLIIAFLIIRLWQRIEKRALGDASGAWRWIKRTILSRWRSRWEDKEPRG